ncbi:hypothetical protein ACHAXN_001216 [Cyclotella atomus]|jgi:hypothetical protein
MDNVQNIVDFLNGVAADDDAADDDAAAGANLNYPSPPSTPDSMDIAPLPVLELERIRQIPNSMDTEIMPAAEVAK